MHGRPQGSADPGPDHPEDLKANGNNNWDGGNILDPENGKVYSAKMSLDESGQKLTVRGFIGISLIGRSQTWIREQ